MSLKHKYILNRNLYKKVIPKKGQGNLTTDKCNCEGIIIHILSHDKGRATVVEMSVQKTRLSIRERKCHLHS